ncbi:protein ACCELERATED CELL DEATH 6-like [Carex rostrata]
MSDSDSSASSPNPPVIPIDPRLLRQLLNSCFLLINACSERMINSATIASSSSPPVIPMDPQRLQQLLNACFLLIIACSQRMTNSATIASSSSPPVIPIDPQLLRQLLKACSEGDVSLCINLFDTNPDILLSTTPHKNNCLHISAMLGHHEFAREAWSRHPNLFSGTNIDGETPLIAALMAPNPSLASDIITAASQYMPHNDLEEGRPFNRMLLKADRRNENALHHAMRNGFENLALQLLEIEPRLSEQVNNTGESPMYMAARRGYSRVIERLVQIPSSAVFGPDNESAMHAAVRFDHPDIVKQLLEGRSQLAYREDKHRINPMHRAVLENKLMSVKIFLEYDPNLAYIEYEPTRNTPFNTAVEHGYLPIAKEIMSTCPDSVYTPDEKGDSALHNAIFFKKPHSIDNILRTPQLHRFINQTNNNGDLPLHRAADECDPKLLRSLLTHAGQDYTAINVKNKHAVDIVNGKKNLWKTLKWNESFTLLSNVIPSGWNYVIRDNTKMKIQMQAREKVQSLTRKYTSNTSLVAALLATITFAAAFTLPGGFSSDSSNAGQPLFARKAAFQVFLISDTIAMCSSLAVAFLCILATWEDLDFLLNYRKTTRALMWCAYGATAIAFGTGLFTVIAPKNLWLAIPILVLCTILPLLSKIIGDWPLLMLRYRLGGLFQKDLVPNI